MKRIFSLILCLLLVAVWAVPVSAADPEIIFTDESFYHPGFTMEVDEGETLLSCYNSISDIYNAYLEGFVEYTWFRDGVPFMEGSSMYITESHRGHTFYLAADLYSDADLTDFVGTIYSQSFTVPEAEKPTIPEITTKQLPNAVVGQEYDFQLECTNPDVTYSLFRSSLPDGLYLTQHGEIEGVPEKAGMWYVVIEATPEAGEAYAYYAEYEFYINEAGDTYSLEIMRLPDKLVYTAGEKLDMKGLKVRIYTPDGFIDSYDGKYLEYSQKALVTLGEQKIKISYQDAFEFFIVTVVAGEGTDPEETEPAETTEATDPEGTEPTETTEEEKGPGKKPGKNPEKDPEKEPGKGTSDGKGDTTTIGATDPKGGPDIMLILVIALGVIAVGAVTALIVVMAKKKKN